MHRIYKCFLFIVIVLSSRAIIAQEKNDSIHVSVNPQLIDIFNSKPPKEYTIKSIMVTGSKSFDPNLIISISGLAAGDKVLIPGSDVFSKAISKLWKQNLIADVEIFFTQLVGKDLYVELAIKERPRLSDFRFVGVKKGEKDDLEKKVLEKKSLK